MDPIKTIGHRIGASAQRDAIHIAILPVIAAEDLWAPCEVALVYGTKDQVKQADSVYGIKTLGIIDPFIPSLEKQIKKGEWVWCFLHPGSITGLRHDWTHPQVDGYQPPKSKSEEWLKRFADEWDFDYDQMIANAQEHEGYVVSRGHDLHSASELDAGDEELFWRHLETLTGKTYDQAHRTDFTWSCTC